MNQRPRRASRSADRSPQLVPARSVISSLSASKRDPDRITVRVGRDRFGPIERRDAEELGLRAGLEWTDSLAKLVAAAQARAGARRYAMRALAARPMSRRELTDRMMARGCDAGSADDVAARLEAAGLIDDAAFAESMVRSQLARKPAGRTLLVAKLRQKRVEPEAAKRAVDQALRGTDQTAGAADMALKRALRMNPKLGREVIRRRLMGLLARRGFDGEVCREALERTMKKLDSQRRKQGLGEWTGADEDSPG